MKRKPIQLEAHVHAMLTELAGKHETYSEVVERLVTAYKKTKGRRHEKDRKVGE